MDFTVRNRFLKINALPGRNQHRDIEYIEYVEIKASIYRF